MFMKSGPGSVQATGAGPVSLMVDPTVSELWREIQ
jgi:hypothetical protein